MHTHTRTDTDSRHGSINIKCFSNESTLNTHGIVVDGGDKGKGGDHRNEFVIQTLELFKPNTHISLLRESRYQ